VGGSWRAVQSARCAGRALAEPAARRRRLLPRPSRRRPLRKRAPDHGLRQQLRERAMRRGAACGALQAPGLRRASARTETVDRSADVRRPTLRPRMQWLDLAASPDVLLTSGTGRSAAWQCCRWE